MIRSRGGVGGRGYFGPEAEFFILDGVRFDQDAHSGYYFVDSMEGIWESGSDRAPNLGYKPRHKEGYFPVPPTDSQQDIRTEMVLEMEKAGICRFQFSHNPRGSGFVEIDAEYWPYLKPGQDPRAEECAAFVAEIRKMLQTRACVKSLASTADEILARQWFEAGISLERIEQAILMGCIRKYVSWRNNQTRTLIGSLQYFAPVLEEVRQTKVDPDYWGYLRYRLVRMENQWKLHRGEHPDKEEMVQEQII